MESVKLTKGENIKYVSNPEIINALTLDGWVIECENAARKATESEQDAPAKRGRPKKD